MRWQPSRSWRALIGLASLVATLIAPAGPALAGAEYDMVTSATYVVDDADGVVRVTVDMTFTNTFAPPAGQVSVFPAIRLAIHDEAAALAAADSAGALTVSAAKSGGVNVATITPRAPVGYNNAAHIFLTYELRDAADSAVRVGTHLVSFPVWGFGTRSEVTVDLPASFDIRVDGNQLEATVEGDRAILSSGVIDNPTRWLSHVGATREPDYATIQQAVPLDGGTVDLQVEHWVDDPTWGAETAALVADALPLLEAAFGVPYPGQGPLVISEMVTAGPDTATDEGGIAVGFTEPPFTVLHQLAHVWAGQAFTGDRWLLEGLASWAAGAVSAEMDIDLPHDPAAVAETLKANAFPLVEWDEAERAAEAEGWAYAASWSHVAQAAAAAGAEPFREALARMAAGADAYEPTTVGTADAGVLADDTGSAPAVSSRAFLDHLDAVTDEPVVDALAGPVLGAVATEELTARAAARVAYDGLLAAAGDWGDPLPVRAAMVAWQFADAERAIAEAGEWLAGRDVLLADLGVAGLAAPERLTAAYRQHGGGPEAWAEIDAERAVAGAFTEVADSVAGGLDPFARVGLLLGPGPEDRLATAATAFAAGDLRVAADEVAGLNQDLATATAGGLVRLLGLLVAVGAAFVVGTIAVRRGRTGRDYTPEP